MSDLSINERFGIIDEEPHREQEAEFESISDLAPEISQPQELQIPEDLKPMYEYCKNYHRVPVGTKAEWWNTMELIERIARLEGKK